MINFIIFKDVQLGASKQTVTHFNRHHAPIKYERNNLTCKLTSVRAVVCRLRKRQLLKHTCKLVYWVLPAETRVVH